MRDPEVIFASIVWTSAVLYSLLAVVDSGKYFETYEDKYGDFKDGWLVRDRKKDVADSEYEASLVILYSAYMWMIINIIVSEYLRSNKLYKSVPWMQLVLGLSFVIYYTGILASFFVILQPVLFQVFYKFRRKICIWICSGIWLFIITYLKSVNFEDIPYKTLQYNDYQHYFLIMTVCWMNLRCLSYYLDLVDIKDAEHNFIQVLSYCFYLPTLFLGPFISFSSFERSRNTFELILTQRLSTLLFRILRFGTWFVVAEYFLHYAYVNAISFQPELVHNFNCWSLYGYGYGMGQFFHLKYVFLYGISTSLAEFENIEVPPTPKCIGRIHLYSDMWRHFDVGLYKFLVRYIYLPSLRTNSCINKMYSSFLCFLFVYVWHGIQNHILVWVVLNFLGIIIENVFSNICNYYNLQHYFSYKIQRILLSVLASPLLAISALSNFYFFAGMEIGLVFTKRLFDSWYPTVVLLFFLSCCCCVSMEVKHWEQTNKRIKKSVIKSTDVFVKKLK